MAHAVRRDLHKMKANLRLRTVRDAQGQEIQVGCYEPARFDSQQAMLAQVMSVFEPAPFHEDAPVAGRVV